MSDSPNYRRERIERLLEELRYEVTRGMMEREIDETIGFEFIVPVSHSIPKGVVHCMFHTRPTLGYNIPPHLLCPPRLRAANPVE